MNAHNVTKDRILTHRGFVGDVVCEVDVGVGWEEGENEVMGWTAVNLSRDISTLPTVSERWVRTSFGIF